MNPSHPAEAHITVNSRWWGEHIQCKVTVTRVTTGEVSYAAIDRPFAGTVPQWKFLDQFQGLPEKKKRRWHHNMSASQTLQVRPPVTLGVASRDT